MPVVGELDVIGGASLLYGKSLAIAEGERYRIETRAARWISKQRGVSAREVVAIVQRRLSGQRPFIMTLEVDEAASVLQGLNEWLSLYGRGSGSLSGCFFDAGTFPEGRGHPLPSKAGAVER